MAIPTTNPPPNRQSSIEDELNAESPTLETPVSIDGDDEPFDPDMDAAFDFIASPDNDLSLHESAEESGAGNDPAGSQGQVEGGNPPQVTPPQQVVPPAAVPPVAPPQATPPVQTPQQQVIESPPQAPPANPAQPGPASAAAGPQLDPAERFRQIHDAIRESQAQVEAGLASQMYQLTAEETERMAIEPHTVIPQLMARVHVNAVRGVLAHVSQQIAPVVSSLIAAHGRNSELENAFYSQFPGLNRAVHGDLVKQIGATYRQINPNATFQQFCQVVGEQALSMVANGQAPGAPVQTPGIAQVPQAPQRRVVKTQPFTPAAPNRATAPQSQSPRASNEWERFADIFDAEAKGHLDGLV